MGEEMCASVLVPAGEMVRRRRFNVTVLRECGGCVDDADGQGGEMEHPIRLSVASKNKMN